jgi:hypothetical protein
MVNAVYIQHIQPKGVMRGAADLQSGKTVEQLVG